MRTNAQRPRLPFVAVAAVFALNGLMFSSWFPYVAIVATRLELDEAQLGLALLGLPVGLIAGVSISFVLMRRWGPRPVIAVGLLLYCAGMALPGLAPDQYWLAVCLAVPGLANGVLDPAQHLEVNKLARATGRELQGYFTGIFSAAQVLSALTAPVAIHAGVPPAAYLGAAAAVGVTVASWTVWRLMRADPVPSGERKADADHSQARRGRRWWAWALSLATLALAGFVTEGIWADWHGLYLSGPGIGASSAVAALGYTAFQLASVAARLGHPLLVERLAGRGRSEWVRLADGRFKTVRTAVVVALAGAIVVVTAGSPAMGLVGAFLLGLGAGPIVPLAMSAAGEDERAVTLATVAGYGGLTAAPAAIGFIAHALSLRAAFWVLVAAAGVMALTMWTVGTRPRHSARRRRGRHEPPGLAPGTR